MQHGEDLRSELDRAGEDGTLADRVRRDWEAAGLDERRLAVCRYARKATRTPSEMTEEDLAPLREHGLDDRDLLTLAHVVSFFNGTNRVADCLHVDPEPD